MCSSDLAAGRFGLHLGAQHGGPQDGEGAEHGDADEAQEHGRGVGDVEDVGQVGAPVRVRPGGEVAEGGAQRQEGQGDDVVDGQRGQARGELIAGIRKGGWFDATALVLSLVVIAVPTFVIGFVMQFVIGVKLGWLPTTAGNSPGFRELLMPALVLGGVSFAYVLRLTRTQVAENLSADHVRTGRQIGRASCRERV